MPPDGVGRKSQELRKIPQSTDSQVRHHNLPFLTPLRCPGCFGTLYRSVERDYHLPTLRLLKHAEGEAASNLSTWFWDYDHAWQRPTIAADDTAAGKDLIRGKHCTKPRHYVGFCRGWLRVRQETRGFLANWATPANLRVHDSIPETLMPEGNKSRISGDGLESNRPATNFPWI